MNKRIFALNISALAAVDALIASADTPEATRELLTEIRASAATKEDIFEVVKQRRGKDYDFGDFVGIFGESDSPYVLAAREHVEEGTLELDQVTVVSEGSDDGAYVMAWLWIDKSSAPFPASLLEDLYNAVRNRPELRHERDWLEDLLVNYADELDELPAMDVDPTKPPGHVCWVDEADQTHMFLPSVALQAMLDRAQGELERTAADRLKPLIACIGPKLDRCLRVLQTPL